MSTGQSTETILGCDPQVRVVISEDEGNLVVQVFALDPAATDVDALFFNLTNDAVASDVTIYPAVDTQEITGFDVAPGTLNQMNNGAQLQEAYDCRIEFGQLPSTSQGDIDQAAFTLYLDGEMPLSLSDIDISNMTAVINSDGGNGLALTSSAQAPAPMVETVAVSEDFSGIWSPDQSDAVESDAHWGIHHGKLLTNGWHDGTLQFESVETDGPVSFSVEAQGINLNRFDADGWGRDSLRVEVRLDNGDWILLDEFVVNDAGTALVGSETGQIIGSESGALSYSGGVLDAATDEAQFRIVSDISSYDEIVLFDNVEITVSEAAEAGTGVGTEVVQSEDFDDVYNPSHSAEVVRDDGWEIRNGQAYTDGCNDGKLIFAEVETSEPVALNIDMRAENLRNFENGGWNADSLRLEVQIDGGNWVLLDEFQVNDAGTAMVGSETGQTFDTDLTTLNYSGGVLDTANEDVQFRLVSDLSARDEKIYVDNMQVLTIDDVEGADHIDAGFDEAEVGDTASDQFAGFTVSAQRAGDDPNSENDAMIFDTANPTGGDHDLGFADEGNAIIISEDNDADDPDDNAQGGTITFNFTDPSDVVSLTLLDVEEQGGVIDLYDIDGTLLNSVDIPVRGDHSAQDLDIDTDGVSVMDVTFAGSGAVSNLRYVPTTDDDEDCAQYAVGYDDIALKTALLEEPEEEEQDDAEGMMAFA
ncbi:hypothetical protein [Puniceibacterium sp. IMCC21224]|uniref:hypothetical protein n=1 Tax=Puniceibacterium sp. IMCC21224 TaxID=1618204 RepID=UPI00064D8F7B|nr:hypothetical protein [Puniceibacterium sp. IMCC21224]KMK67181.1 hypothetical protein IMCC21224_112046 [Puniceibacterium sp. IMCC21224]